MSTQRRPLSFASLDEIGPEVDRLVAASQSGRLRMAGRWTLPQILWHLATVTRRVTDMPASTVHDPAHLVSPEERERVLASGRIPEGLPAPEPILPPADATDPDGEAARLRDALAYFRSHPTGPLAPHRFFGHLTRDQWAQLQCIHCAHHLSFAVPDEA